MSLRNFFTARVYAKLLHNDPYGRISNMQFFNYVMRKGVDPWICAELQVSPDAGFLIQICFFPSFTVWLHQTRIGLSLYDVAGQGYLRELVSAVLFFLSGEVALRLQVDSCGLTVGSGELHPGVDPHSASARWPGEVLLLLLRLHCRSQVLFLPGPASNR